MPQRTTAISLGVAKGPTPLFNTPHLRENFGGKDGDTLSLDDQNLFRPVETVLPPGSRIKLYQRIGDSSIREAAAEDYPYEGDFYVDERFIDIPGNIPAPRMRGFPSLSTILNTLKSLEKTRYIWGGNWPQGVDLLPELYPSRTPLSQRELLIQDTWRLKGVDCSGLLHYATDGWTPRNTSSLVNFGKRIEVEGKSAEEIVETLRPLDTLSWIGHVICVLDPHSIIESTPQQGVVIRPALERIEEILRERRPVNDWASTNGTRFVVKRWHPDF